MWILSVCSTVLRMGREERVAHNREVVLSTAREVFAERGYGAATLDQIAEAAGFSKGVVYSQFDSKADLFLTVLERRVEERAAQNRRSVEDLDGSIELDQLVEGFVESMLGNDPAWRLAVIEVRVAAARDEALLDRYRQVHARTVDQLAEVMTEVLARVGIEPVVPPVVMASALLAVDVGITLEAAASPGVARPAGARDADPPDDLRCGRTVRAAATEGAVMREQTTDDWTVGRHLTALLAAAPESIDRLSWSREQIDAHQEAAMRRLLAHAVEHSAFHARRLRGVDIDGWRLADLAALPVMTKRDMMGAFDSVLTDPSVTKATRRGSSRCSRSIAGLPRRPVPGDHVRRQFRRARRVRVGCRGVHRVHAVDRAPNNGQARLVRRHTETTRCRARSSPPDRRCTQPRSSAS